MSTADTRMYVCWQRYIAMSNDLESLRGFFWDTDVTCLDAKKNMRFIIERLLVYGTQKEIQWLLTHYTNSQIIEVVKISKSIDKKTAHYWSLYFHISKGDILCLNRQLMHTCFY